MAAIRSDRDRGRSRCWGRLGTGWIANHVMRNSAPPPAGLPQHSQKRNPPFLPDPASHTTVIRLECVRVEFTDRFPPCLTRTPTEPSCSGSHLPQLGIASAERRDLKTQADYDALFEDYERTSLPQQSESLAQIQGWIKEGERVALTCFELHPHQCHRHCVAEALERQAVKKLRAVHL